MKKVVEYHVVDDLGRGDSDFTKESPAKFYAGDSLVKSESPLPRSSTT